MRIYIKNFIFMVLIVIAFFSCNLIGEEDNEVTYLINGNITSAHQDPSGFTLEVMKHFSSGIDFDYELLGSTTVDSNGDFSFTYKTSENGIVGNKLHMYLYDKEGKSRANFLYLPFAQNWTKNFNYSKNSIAEVTFYSNEPLKEGDTLFLETSTGRDYISYPLPNGFKKTYFLLNDGEQYICWSRERKNLVIGKCKIVPYIPTGAPTIDQIQLNY